MAPVELGGLAGLEHQRDEGRATIAGIPAPIGLPARRVAPHGIVGALKTLALQQIMDPRHPQPLALAAHLILFQQCVQAILKRPDPRQRLNLALIVECAFRRPDRLADHLPRYMQIPRDRLDRLTTGILRSEEHTSELQSLMRNSYAGFC